MAVYKLFPSKDATLYSAYPAMNTGLDAILEVKNEVTESGASPRVSRAVIAFDQSEINGVIDDQITSSLAISASLKAYVAKATGIIMDSNLYAYAISGSWNNGSGQYLDNVQRTNGTSWTYSSFSGSRKWQTGGFTNGVTASFQASNPGGGNWFTTASGYAGLTEITASQNFNLRSDKDLNMDVTNIVKMWYSSSKGLNSGLVDQENAGFLLKWGDSEEFNTSSSIQPNLKFYSVDTNTIYPPQLEIKWRDFSYATTIGAIKSNTWLSGSNYPTVPGDQNWPTINNSASLSPFPSPITFANFTASRVGTGSGDGIHIDLTMNGHSITRANVTRGGEGYKAGDKIRITSQSLLDKQVISYVSGDLDFVIRQDQIDNLDVINTPDMFVALDDNPGVFYSESINKFRLNVRPDFPRRTFLTSSIETQNHALPSASYYAIKDLDTNEFVVDFDTQYTQISCDVTGSHFTVYMNGLEPERYYQILVQTTVNGNTIVKDENYYFKVVNG